MSLRPDIAPNPCVKCLKYDDGKRALIAYPDGTAMCDICAPDMLMTWGQAKKAAPGRPLSLLRALDIRKRAPPWSASDTNALGIILTWDMDDPEQPKKIIPRVLLEKAVPPADEAKRANKSPDAYNEWLIGYTNDLLKNTRAVRLALPLPVEARPLPSTSLDSPEHSDVEHDSDDSSGSPMRITSASPPSSSSARPLEESEHGQTGSVIDRLGLLTIGDEQVPAVEPTSPASSSGESGSSDGCPCGEEHVACDSCREYYCTDPEGTDAGMVDLNPATLPLPFTDWSEFVDQGIARQTFDRETARQLRAYVARQEQAEDSIIQQIVHTLQQTPGGIRQYSFEGCFLIHDYEPATASPDSPASTSAFTPPDFTKLCTVCLAELVFSQVAAWWRSKPEEVVELEPEEDAALNKSRSTDADTSQSSGKMSSVVFEIVGDAAETTGLIAEDMDEDGAESAANDSGEIPAEMTTMTRRRCTPESHRLSLTSTTIAIISGSSPRSSGRQAGGRRYAVDDLDPRSLLTPRM